MIQLSILLICLSLLLQIAAFFLCLTDQYCKQKLYVTKVRVACTLIPGGGIYLFIKWFLTLPNK